MAFSRTNSVAVAALAALVGIALQPVGTAAAQSYWPNAQPVWRSPPQQTTVTVPTQPSEKLGSTGFEPQVFAARGDLLDPWCKSATTAVNVANCGDADLRALAIERLRAFDQARSQLSWDQQKALAADQNRWAGALAGICDLESDEPPSLPLSRSAKDCLVREGRSRLAYLQAYGAAMAGPNPGPPATVAIPPATMAAPAPPTAVSIPPATTVTPAKSPPQPQPVATAPRATPSQLVAGAAPPWAQTDIDKKPIRP